jgi:hypothetical protein
MSIAWEDVLYTASRSVSLQRDIIEQRGEGADHVLNGLYEVSHLRRACGLKI